MNLRIQQKSLWIQASAKWLNTKTVGINYERDLYAPELMNFIVILAYSCSLSLTPSPRLTTFHSSCFGSLTRVNIFHLIIHYLVFGAVLHALEVMCIGAFKDYGCLLSFIKTALRRVVSHGLFADYYSQNNVIIHGFQTLGLNMFQTMYTRP